METPHKPHLLPQGDVLEISAGTGRNLQYYNYPRLRSLTLLDSSNAMLHQARHKFQQLKDQGFRNIDDSFPIAFQHSDAHQMVQLPTANVDLSKLRGGDGGTPANSKGTGSGWRWIPWGSRKSDLEADESGGQVAAEEREEQIETASQPVHKTSPDAQYRKFDPFVASHQSSSAIRDETGFRQYIPVNRYKTVKNEDRTDSSLAVGSEPSEDTTRAITDTSPSTETITPTQEVSSVTSELSLEQEQQDQAEDVPQGRRRRRGFSTESLFSRAFESSEQRLEAYRRLEERRAERMGINNPADSNVMEDDNAVPNSPDVALAAQSTSQSPPASTTIAANPPPQSQIAGEEQVTPPQADLTPQQPPKEGSLAAQVQDYINATDTDALETVTHLRQFPPRSFDTVIDTFGLCSFKDPQAVMEEIKRVLRPGGKVIMIEHGQGNWGFVNQLLHKNAEKHHEIWGCWWNRDLMPILRGSGLKLESVGRWHFGTTYVVMATYDGGRGRRPPQFIVF